MNPSVIDASPTGITDRTVSPDDPGAGGSGWQEARFEHFLFSISASEARDRIHVDQQTAQTYSAVWACRRVITEALASLGWHTYESGPGGRGKLPLDDDAKWLLDAQPNNETGAFQWRETMIDDALGWGNGISEIVRDTRGRPVEMWHIAPHRVQPDRLKRTGELIYVVDNGHGQRESILMPQDVFHLRNRTSDTAWGLSPIELHRQIIELGLQKQQYGSSFFGRGPMPGGILKLPGAVTKPERDRMQASFEKSYGGSRNAGRVVAVSGGVEFMPLSMPNKDAEWIESCRFSIEEVCRIYGVPPHKIAMLDRCMPASTLVYAESGPRQIADVRKGERVWSADAGRIRLANVVDSWQSGTKVVLTIRTTNRTVRATGNHRMMVRRKSLRPLMPGETGGTNVDGKKFRVVWQTKYVPAGELRVGDVLVTLAELPASGVRTAPSGRQLSIGFMEFAGLLIGDGNILAEDRMCGRKHASVTVARGDHARYMGHYREVMQQEFTNRSGAAVHLTESGRSTRFRSVIAAEELAWLGLGGRAKTKTVPEWVYSVAPDLQLAFLRGFLDADGTVDGKGRITFYSTSQALLAGIRHLCMGLGIPVTNARHDDQTGTQPFMTNPVLTRVYRFTCSDPGANKRIGSHDPRYQERFAAGSPFSRKDRKYPRHGGKADIKGASVSRIVEIRSGPPEPVYDLQVEGSQNFIADGVFVHNSTNNNIEHQGIEFVSGCVMPWARRLESEADVKMYGRNSRGRKWTKLNLAALQRGDSVSQADSLGKQVTTALLTPNEGREELDRNPVEGGDTLMIQGAMVSLDRAQNPPEPPAPAPAPSEPPKPPAKAGADARPVFRQLFEEAYGRILRIEGNRARSALKKMPLATWAKETYEGGQPDFVAAAIRPIVDAAMLCAPRQQSDATTITLSLAACYCRDNLADMLAGGESCLDSWTSRARGAAAEAVYEIFGDK